MYFILMNNLDTITYKMSKDICHICRIFSVILSTVIIPSKGVVLDCYSTTRPEYDGHQQTTVTGMPCLRWDQFPDYNAGDFPDATKSDAANFCRTAGDKTTLWCLTTNEKEWEKCGINKCGDDGLSKCGQLTINKPTILGRYVEFSFTPDMYDRNAILEWQRSMNGIDQWKTLPLNIIFTQYEKNSIYNLILTNSEKNQDERFYRIHYYNETIHCWMDAGELTLEAINNSCGLVYLRSEKVIVNGTVKIEYYPSTDVMQNNTSFERRWIHSVRGRGKVLSLVGGSYEETFEQNNKYVLTIFMFNISMNGDYGVYCGSSAKYTDFITVKIPEPPGVPEIVGLQDIENCTDCVVGEDNEKFKLACEIYGGSRPLTVTMNIGNETMPPQEWNSTTFMVFFTVRDHHHMESVICSVMNDALSSPLSATAQMFVIKTPTIQFSVPEILRDGEAVNITCTIDDGRPNPNVYFSISGSEVSSANSHYFDSTTSLNTNIITLATFKKEWNKENITCCRYNEWYKLVRDCSPPKQVNYLFPPTNLMLEVKVDEGRQMYATCTVYDSNPVCSVQFKAQSGIIGSKRFSENISLPHGAWNSVYEVNLNVSDEDNGKDVTCMVECDEFPVDLTDTVKILLPCTNETGVGLGAVIGSVIAALAVGILIGVTCTMYILTRKGIIAGSKTQPTVSREIELTGPPTALDTYEQLQNRTDTEIRGTYDSLEVNSRVEQNSQSQYESLNQDVEKYHTYTDLKQSR